MSRWVLFAMAVAFASAPALALPSDDLLKKLESDCNAGDGFACMRWATRLNSSYPRPAQPEKARAAYAKGCEFNESEACAMLYKMVALGQGGPQDLDRAKQLEKAACNHPRLGITADLKGSGLCKD